MIRPALSDTDVYSTGEVARICRVATRTVCKWFDSGELRGYKIPGGVDRRVPRDSLLRFMRKHGLPTDDIDGLDVAKVLIISADAAFAQSLLLALPRERGFKAEAAATLFEAGYLAAGMRPDAVCVDFTLGAGEAVELCRGLRRSDASEALIFALLPDGWRDAFDRSAIDETFRRPFDPALLAARLSTLVGSRKQLVRTAQEVLA